MLREAAIAREVLFPYLEEDRAFQKVPGDFWQVFLKGLLEYEKDPKPVYAALYRLELKDPEKIIKLLPRIYTDFLEELAEQYVLGNAVGMVQNSGLLKNSRFREHLLFFSDLQNAMAKLERKSLIEELPAAYSAITEEISDEAISALITKENREELRKKFKIWEEEEMLMEEVKEIDFSTSYSMDFSGNSFKSNEKQPFVPPPVKKPKFSSMKIWMLVVILVIFMALIVWLVLK